MGTLSKVTTVNELTALIEEIGFLPFFTNSVSGFSVEDVTQGRDWFTGDPKRDPWSWRQIIAGDGRIAYGKLFDKKAGFVSKEWFPVFANYRRDGYDFDARYEDGLAPHKYKTVMGLFDGGAVIPSYQIKQTAGFGGDGEKGFEGVLTGLQMQTYLTTRRFERKRNKRGEEYGWPTACYCTPEELFGEEHVRSAYCEKPSLSRQKIIECCARYFPLASQSDIEKLIK